MKQTLAAILILLSAHTEIVSAAERAQLSGKAEKAAQRLQKVIQSEISQLRNHPWAGDYYQGDGLGVNVRFIAAPKSGYVFEWHGCLGLYDRNYGKVTETNGLLRLDFSYPNNQSGFQGIAAELFPIHWGSRKYLVPTNELVNFCNDVNAGMEPRVSFRGRHLLRKGDETKPVAGKPVVPREYQAFLLDKPITAQIKFVGVPTTRPSRADWNFKDVPVKLNAGRNQGLLPGVQLHVVSPKAVLESVVIQSVREDESEGIIIQIGENEPAPQTGWKVSTRFR